MSQKIEKNYVDATWPFKQVIAFYIVQNETMVVFLELFKCGNFFWDAR